MNGSPSCAAPILPGATIGVFGSGQLGRMLALAARRLGYRLHTYSPDRDSPTGMVADREVTAAYEDRAAVRAFVRGVDVVTFEFENVDPAVADLAEAEGVPVRPGGWVLHTAQNRLREKSFLADAGLPVTPFVQVHSLPDLQHGLEQIGVPAILKTAAFGYDGKGQRRIDAVDEAPAAWHAVGPQLAILERHVPFVKELSVVAARGTDGACACYGVFENIHRNHILDIALAPARVPPAVAARATELTEQLMARLRVIGVLCVELFMTESGDLLINEMAPRPHNSGHLTIDAAVTSQFEQQVRAVCDLPLGCAEFVRPAAMVNLLGDLWQKGTPNWSAALAIPGVRLHLYGKREPRPGRKMGHITVLADSVDEALEVALAAQASL